MSRVELLPAQRHALILGALKNVSAASVQDLAERLGASISTVRRDLLYLTEQGYVDRTHGGAVIRRRPMARFEPEATLAAEMAKRQKEEIAALGASRIEANQSVIFDASSTVYAAARRLAEAQITFTAVTNDLRIAALLSSAKSISTVVTGGTTRSGTMTLTGEPGHAFLRGVHVDVALIGVHTISGGSFTETSLEVAAMKRLMIASASRVIVLADSSKFGPPSFCEICGIGEVEEVITDADATTEQIETIRDFGTRCTVATRLPYA